jgi:hypothetical protein
MITLLLLGFLVQRPGGLPGDWQQLTGVPDLSYRWSRPTSNSCLVEFRGSPSQSGEIEFQVTATIFATLPPGPIQSKAGSAFRVEATRIKPQISDRVFAMRLRRLGQQSQDLHDCYGISQIKARPGIGHGAATEQSLTLPSRLAEKR